MRQPISKTLANGKLLIIVRLCFIKGAITIGSRKGVIHFMFSGSIVALITPFFQGQVDKMTLRSLVKWHLDQGTEGILVCGSTGEGSLLSSQERREILSISVEVAGSHSPIIMGCSSSSTAEVVQMVQEAESLGAAGALVVTPPYVKPTAEGIFQHFHAITKASPLPLIIYNHPGRTGIDLPIPLLTRLANLPTVVGIKDSGMDIRRPLQLRQVTSKPLSLLSGDDPTVGAYLAHGGNGIISVTANIVPQLCRSLMDAWKKHDMETFSALQERLFPLHEALLAETNPTPLKFALSLLGKCQNDVRLPLVPVMPSTEKIIREAMENAGIF